DVLTNAGGVTVSYFEWVQDLGRLFWSRAETRAKLAEKLNDAFDRVWKLADEQGLSLRGAALVAGLREVAGARTARGISPWARPRSLRAGRSTRGSRSTRRSSSSRSTTRSASRSWTTASSSACSLAASSSAVWPRTSRRPPWTRLNARYTGTVELAPGGA